jgi:hypothetical protein
MKQIIAFIFIIISIAGKAQTYQDTMFTKSYRDFGIMFGSSKIQMPAIDSNRYVSNNFPIRLDVSFKYNSMRKKGYLNFGVGLSYEQRKYHIAAPDTFSKQFVKTKAISYFSMYCELRYSVLYKNDFFIFLTTSIEANHSLGESLHNGYFPNTKYALINDLIFSSRIGIDVEKYWNRIGVGFGVKYNFLYTSILKHENKQKNILTAFFSFKYRY